MINFLKNIDPSWTLFLDRDGVINNRIVGGYVSHVDEFEFLPGVLDAFNIFSKRFKSIVIITNQQGIAKGLMTESELHQVHQFMIETINSHGGRVDGIYYCADMATKPNNCRKPKPAMALQAQNDFPDIDFSKSIMVGDMKSDIEFGNNLGMKTLFVSGVIQQNKFHANGVIKGLAELGQRLTTI